MSEAVKVEITGGIARVTLNRPEVRNAFNDELVLGLQKAFTDLDDSVRAVVLTGEGKSFCAGADMKWMLKAIELGDDDNAQDAAEMVKLFKIVDEAPQVVIGRLNGAAIGGGLGLVSCCDVVVAVDTVKFAFTEVKLGVVPAVISPFVMRKMPVSQARRYFVTGEKFTAQAALQMGLVHEVVSAEELDATVDAMAKGVLSNGPKAVAEAKKLVAAVAPPPPQEVLDHTIKTIARLRISEEAQEGFGSFLQKRPPSWMKP